MSLTQSFDKRTHPNKKSDLVDVQLQFRFNSYGPASTMKV